MKTIEIKLFSFNELSEESKKKAIQNNYDINVFDNWYEYVYEDCFEQVQREGFDIEKIYFSGFWSQGDGAMFEYSSISDKLMNDFVDSLLLSPMRKQWIMNNVSISAKGHHKGHYYHENCCYHAIYWEVSNGDLHYSTSFHKWLCSFADDFEDFVINRYKDLCGSIYQSLETEYEHLTSEEMIKETLICNDYDFTENGSTY